MRRMTSVIARPISGSAIGGGSEEEPLVTTLRAAIAAIAAAVEEDRDRALARLKLIGTVPAGRPATNGVAAAAQKIPTRQRATRRDYALPPRDMCEAVR
jgi:hypothetical protein